MELVLDGHTVWLPAVAALGVGVGLIAGMFGVGGGFLMVPLMHVILGVPLRYAIGAALCQTIATGLGAFLRYRKLGFAEWRFDVVAIGGSLVGVYFGTRLLTAMELMGAVDIGGRSLPVQRLVVSVAYCALFSGLAFLLWFRNTPSAGAAVVPGPLARLKIPPLVNLPTAGLEGISVLVLSYVALVNGVLAGLLGIGGGIVMIPIMLYGFGFNIRCAAGSGIIIVLAVAVLGTIEHVRLGDVHLGLVIPLMVGAGLSAQVGATLTRSLSGSTLRRWLAVVLVVTVAALVFKLFR